MKEVYSREITISGRDRVVSGLWMMGTERGGAVNILPRRKGNWRGEEEGESESTGGWKEGRREERAFVDSTEIKATEKGRRRDKYRSNRMDLKINDDGPVTLTGRYSRPRTD